VLRSRKRSSLDRTDDNGEDFSFDREAATQPDSTRRPLLVHFGHAVTVGDGWGRTAPFVPGRLAAGRSLRHASERRLRPDRTHAPAWKHARRTPRRRHCGRRNGPHHPSGAIASPKSAVQISIAPSSSSLALPPSTERRERDCWTGSESDGFGTRLSSWPPCTRGGASSLVAR
jgi:hypothetical protein